MRTEYSDRYIVLGLKIAYYRKKAGFTQEVFAEKIGKSLNFLGQIDGCDMTRECLVKIERCTQHIQVSQLRAIRKALNTSYDALIDGIEDSE